MRKPIYSLFAVLALTAMSCSDKYDDSYLSERVDNLEQRVSALEEQCMQMNTNITSLQTIINVSQSGDYITAISPLYEGDNQIGYTIDFAKCESITIYHGKDGKDGVDGNHGSNGQDGRDGYTPSIGIAQDTDSHYYWTLDGEWLLDDKENKILAEGLAGNDGITPRFKIEDGDWCISLDNGGSWQNLGRAAGADGNDGDSMFSDIDTSDPDFVKFTLADGTGFTVPRKSSLAIEFDRDAMVAMRANATRTIGYTITANTPGNLQVEVLSSGNVRAKVSGTTGTTGTLTVTTGATIDEYDKVVMLVSDGQNTIMKSISFEEAGLRVSGELSYDVDDEGQTIEINIETNANYAVTIPEDAQSWLHNSPQGRGYRNETITLVVDANDGERREARLTLDDEDGVEFQAITIRQAPVFPENMELMFPDPIFRQYILEKFDKDKDNKISKDEAHEIIELEVYQMNIGSLKGIEYFSNLEKLWCYKNQLTQLDVSQNPALTNLRCHDNQLTQLDVSQNPALTELWCGNNQLTQLDVSKNTSLTLLWCGGNKLTQLDVSQNPALTKLDCFKNELKQLDVSQNKDMIDLDCSNNELKQLDVSQNKVITSLSCQNNEITQLDVSQNKALRSINCSRNKLSQLNVTENTALIYLYCSYNELTQLKISENLALTTVWCENNQLTQLEVSKNTALKKLQCFDNKLTQLVVSENASLTELLCHGNELTQLDVSQNQALTELWCGDNQLTQLDVSMNTALKELWCHKNQLTQLNVTKNTALTVLWCEYNDLIQLDVSKNTELKELWCFGNQLTQLNLLQNTKLIKLSCGNNLLTELDVSETNLGESQLENPLACSMSTLETLWLKTGWEINGIYPEKNIGCIDSKTEIKFK